MKHHETVLKLFMVLSYYLKMVINKNELENERASPASLVEGMGQTGGTIR